MSAGLVETLRRAGNLGSELEVEPVRLERRRKVLVTITAHEHGWLIVAQPEHEAKPHSGWFIATILRCIQTHGHKGGTLPCPPECCPDIPRDCLGHPDKVRRLAEKVLKSY